MERIPHWHPDASELDYCLSGAIPKEVLGLTFGVAADRFEGLDLNVAYIAPQ